MNQNNSEGQEKKKGKGLFLTLFLLGITLIAIGGYLCIDKRILSNSKVEQNDQKNENKNEKDEETEITDQNLKNSLTEKIHYLTNYNYHQTNTNAYEFRYENNTNFGDVFHHFNEETKLHVLLTYLNETNKFSNISEINKSNNLVKEYIDAGMEVREISADEVNFQYKLFYGTDVPSYQSVLGNCFRFEYDPTIKTFFWTTPTCGGTTPNLVYSYINQYTKDKENAYVYVSYATSEPKDITGSSYNIYKGLEKEIYQSDVNKETVENFKIDENNQQDFAKYKFTFKKDNSGNYYWINLEKA